MWSLADLCNELLQLELRKPSSLRTGSWEKQPLSVDQLFYAAADAHAGVRLWQVRSFGSYFPKYVGMYFVKSLRVAVVTCNGCSCRWRRRRVYYRTAQLVRTPSVMLCLDTAVYSPLPTILGKEGRKEANAGVIRISLSSRAFVLILPLFPFLYFRLFSCVLPLARTGHARDAGLGAAASRGKRSPA